MGHTATSHITNGKILLVSASGAVRVKIKDWQTMLTVMLGSTTLPQLEDGEGGPW